MAHFTAINKATNEVIQTFRVDNGFITRNGALIPNKANPPQYENIEDESMGVAYIRQLYANGTPWKKPDGSNYNLNELDFKQTWYQANGLPEKRFNFAGEGYKINTVKGGYTSPEPTVPPLKTEEEKTPEEKQSTTPVYKEGTWELDEKLQWTFKSAVKQGIIEQLFRRMFAPAMESKTQSVVTNDTQHQSFNEGFMPTPIKMPWWKKVLQKLRQLFKK
jgi:hypothetical protein